MHIQDLFIDNITMEQLLGNLRSRLESMDEKARYINNNIPNIVEKTILEAEDSYNGMIKLPGTGGVKEFVGNPPTWLERRHNDNEYLWQLNRMTHWQEMLEAYSLTKDEKYAKKVIEELIDWTQTVKVTEEMYDYPIEYFSKCNPLRALEMGIRAYKTWPLVLEHLGRSEFFTEDILEIYIESLYMQMKILRKVSPILWPNADHNHFLMECLGILTTALYFPELKVANEWREFAIDGIERCAKAQLTKDGGQIEGCPSYHNGCMFWFGLASVLSKRFGFEFSKEYYDLYNKNLDYSIHSLRPTGKCFPVGDSHANHLAVMSGVYGCLALDDFKWLELATKLIDEDLVIQEAMNHIWRVLDVDKFYRGLSELKGRDVECNMDTTFWNKDLSQAIIRTSWERDALGFLMTCRSPVQNAHAHIDLMSFDFAALGKNMICDPGIFCYRDDEDRKQFKTTAYHSTIMIDGKDPFEYISSFEFGPQKLGKIYNVEDRENYTIASAVHNNYDPIVHYRHMLLVDDEFIIVVDKLKDLENNEIQRYYHMDFTDVVLEDDYVIGRSEKANLAIYTFPKTNTRLLSGRLSDINDIARDATRVLYEDKASGDKIYITLLCPYRNNDLPNINILEKTKDTFNIIYNDIEYKLNLENNTILLTK